jgi:DNA-directed RNA polymerase specialized sigma24 family protein
VITKLDSFKFNSSFTTWVYRIATNHTLNFIESKKREPLFSFHEYGEKLDRTPDLPLAANAYPAVGNEVLVEEVKQTCMSGMLMCLAADSRLVFIIGEILGFNDKVGSEITGLSPENFRMTLSRAKKDLYNFMNDKCGLVNKNNPCRCTKKTKAFIEAGYVNPDSLLFYPKYKSFVENIVADKQHEMESDLYSSYQKLFRDQTVLSNREIANELAKILASPKIKNIFELN